ncbi:MAG: hypothetical protein EBZ51_08110 [Synechococcaceae bacterium WB9_2_112]|nr:hypothetical protein [Synechococcaceae bacterium WB9_2_112]
MDGLAASGKDSDIDQLLGNIKGMASSSGGSWFSSMLSFSQAFRSQFESKAGRDNYNSSGYNGQIRQIFSGLFNMDGTPRLTPTVKPYVDAVELALNTAQSLLKLSGVNFDAVPLIDSVRQTAMAYTLLDGQSGLNWRRFIDTYVYKPLAMDLELKNITLTSQRNTWARDVDLVFGAAMQTSAVVLGKTGSGLTTSYGRVSALPNAPGVPLDQQFTPLSLLSSASIQPAELPKASALFTAGSLQSTYKDLKLGRAKVIQKPIPSQLSNTLSLIDATTISSAFGAVGAGLGAVASVLTSSPTLQESLNTLLTPISDLLRNEAPAAGIAKSVLGPLPEVPPTSRTLDVAAQLGALRLADSAYTDNTAVGHLLRQIQDSKGTTSPFSIILLMNSNEAPDPLTGLQKQVRVGPDASMLSRFGLPSEVTNLFGQSKGDGSLDGDSITMVRFPIVKVPSAHLFDEAAWYGRTAPDWSYSKGSINLSYHKLSVTTVENMNFGVKAGQNGQLHVFSAINTESAPAPFSSTVLSEYAENYDVLREAIASGGGFAHLQNALGLTPVGA